jgi:transposase InsO family protein
VAERINGILKYQFGLRESIVKQKMAHQAVRIYNERRLHWCLGFKTPQIAHNQFDRQKYKSYRKNAA